MRITFRKFRDKPTVMTCVRDDGTETWQSYGHHSDFFAIHDMTHFALETELGYRHAFFGMLAAGRDISDFGPGDAAKLRIEAIYAEYLAGLLTTTDRIGSRLSYREIKDTIDGKVAEIGVPPISLSESEFETIIARIQALSRDWEAVPVGASMTVEFIS